MADERTQPQWTCWESSPSELVHQNAQALSSWLWLEVSGLVVAVGLIRFVYPEIRLHKGP